MAEMSGWMSDCLDDGWKAKIATKLAENLPGDLMFSLAQGIASGFTLDVCDTKKSMEHHLIHLVWRKTPRKDLVVEESRPWPSLADFCFRPTVPPRRRRRNSRRKQKSSVNDDSLSDDLNPAPSQSPESSPVQSAMSFPPVHLPGRPTSTPSPTPKAPDIDPCKPYASSSSVHQTISASGEEEEEWEPGAELRSMFPGVSDADWKNPRLRAVYELGRESRLQSNEKMKKEIDKMRGQMFIGSSISPIVPNSYAYPNYHPYSPTNTAHQSPYSNCNSNFQSYGGRI